MGSSRISYAQLLETNNLIQGSADETYWLCVTRTVQESKLFPVPAYMMLSYMMCYYRYPSLLRKIESRMSAEEMTSDPIFHQDAGGDVTGQHLLSRTPQLAPADLEAAMKKAESLGYVRTAFKLTPQTQPLP